MLVTFSLSFSASTGVTSTPPSCPPSIAAATGSCRRVFPLSASARCVSGLPGVIQRGGLMLALTTLTPALSMHDKFFSQRNEAPERHHKALDSVSAFLVHCISIFVLRNSVREDAFDFLFFWFRYNFFLELVLFLVSILHVVLLLVRECVSL